MLIASNSSMPKQKTGASLSFGAQPKPIESFFTEEETEHFELRNHGPIRSKVLGGFLSPHLDALLKTKYVPQLKDAKANAEAYMAKHKDALKLILNNGNPDLELNQGSRIKTEPRSDAEIPIELPGGLTLNRALRNNHPLVFKRTTNSFQDVRNISPERNTTEITEQKEKLNLKDHFGLTAFHTAILTQNPFAAELLLRKGANPWLDDNSGQNALDHLAEIGETEQLEKLLMGEQINQSSLGDKESPTPNIQRLLETSKTNQQRILRFKNAFDELSEEEKAEELLDTFDIFSEAPLAALHRLIALKAAGVDLNANLSTGHQPLQRALETGNDEAIQSLLKAGADPDRLDTRGKSILLDTMLDGNDPTHLVEQDEDFLDRMFETLLKAGANPDIRDQNGQMPLMRAISKPNEARGMKMLKALLQAGADPNGTTTENVTPLRNAAVFGKHPKMVEALLKSGANPYTPTSCGETVFSEAVYSFWENNGRNNTREVLQAFMETIPDTEQLEEELNTKFDKMLRLRLIDETEKAEIIDEIISMKTGANSKEK